MVKVLFWLLVAFAPLGGEQVEPSRNDSTIKRVTAPDTLVFITRDGKKYHREECHHLRKSKLTVSLAEAIGNNYEPCKRCYKDSTQR